MSHFYQRLQEDLEQVCDPADVMLVTHVNGTPSMVTVQVRSTSDESCRVILHAGMVDSVNRELTRRMDVALRALLERPPYKLVKRTPDTTATHYLVQRSAEPVQSVPAPAVPGRAAAEPPPVSKAPVAPQKLTIVVSDTNLAPAAQKIPAETLAAMGFVVEPHHKANLSSDAPAHINFSCDAATWKSVFGSAAGAYVAKMTELSRKHRDSRRELRAATTKNLGQSAAAIQRFAAMLAQTQKAHGEPMAALLCFDQHRLSLRVPLNNEDEASESIARFTAGLDAIAVAAQTLTARLIDGKRLLAKIEDAGFSLEWVNKADQRLCVQHFDPTGKALGPPTRADSF